QMTYDASERGELPLQTGNYVEAFKGQIDGDPWPQVNSALESLMASHAIIADRQEYAEPPYLTLLVRAITPTGIEIIENGSRASDARRARDDL
ncbi:MAG TPA: hypothetical protein VGN14_17745, partial [Candidatus Elarobacter sp.]